MPNWDGKSFVGLGTADIGAYTPTRRTAAVSGAASDRVQDTPFGAPQRPRVPAWDAFATVSLAARSHLVVPTVAPTAMGALVAVQERVGQTGAVATEQAAQRRAALAGRLVQEIDGAEAAEGPRTFRCI